MRIIALIIPLVSAARASRVARTTLCARMLRERDPLLRTTRSITSMRNRINALLHSATFEDDDLLPAMSMEERVAVLVVAAPGSGEEDD